MSNQPGTEPEPRGQGGALAALGTLALVAATVLAGVLLPARDGHRPPAQSVAEDAACLEWTDGCRVCRRLVEGPACSLPGIACQPGAPRCLTRAGG